MRRSVQLIFWGAIAAMASLYLVGLGLNFDSLRKTAHNRTSADYSADPVKYQDRVSGESGSLNADNAAEQIGAEAQLDTSNVLVLKQQIKLLQNAHHGLTQRLSAIEGSMNTPSGEPTPVQIQPSQNLKDNSASAHAGAKSAGNVSVRYVPLSSGTESGRTESHFAIQLATSTTLEGLRKNWNRILKRHPNLLGSLKPLYIAVPTNGQQKPHKQWYQLIAGPLQNQGKARQLCAKLTAYELLCKESRYQGQIL